MYKIYRKTDNGWKVLENAKKIDVFKPAQSQTKHEEVHNQAQKVVQQEIGPQNDEIQSGEPNCRQNEMKIQMLSKLLYDQIFKNNPKNVADEQKIEKLFSKFIIHYFQFFK